MHDVTVIIPARNEQFLNKTIEDIVEKREIDTHVIAVLEGYWPEPIVNHPKVHYIHFSQPRGMRGALNAGVEIARSKFVMKLDGHCMVSQGFDKVLAETCRPNWVCVPTRHRLDPENWVINDGNRHPINYQYINPNNDSLDGKVWDQKNRNKALEKIRIDDLISCQGSCYFMHRDWWHEMELLDEENYGTFRKDPQEVTFKTWTYGGRCVRVKDCWYAHLHKGRKYGRGYFASKSDHNVGDEYVKKWWTDSAWHKQKIPLRDIFAKFPDMPGWQDHEWMQQGAKAIPMTNLPRTYQYLEVGGDPITRTPTDRTGSRFWNEGKWENFISPLLPEDCTDQTFVEMGCDAGLFLKMAKDRGFQRVVGVEKNKTPYRAGILYRDTMGYDYTILKRKLGGHFGEAGNFDIDELPVADITLMSTFHYHLDINSWYRYLDRLITKTCYVLIVSNPETKRFHWKVMGQLGYLHKYFANWEQVQMVDGVPEEGDPKPRKLFSVLFKSPYLRRVPIDAVKTRSGMSYGTEGMQKLTERLMAGEENIDVSTTALYADWAKRKPRWSDRTLRQFIQRKHDMTKSVIEDGMKEPILVQKDSLKLSDGGHRLVILKTQGYQSVIVREL